MDDRGIGQAVAPALGALDSFLAVVDKAKETSVPMKGSVWDVANDRVHGLERTEKAARELRTELREWQEESERLDASLRALESEVEDWDDGSDYDAVTGEFADAMAAMESLEEKSERVQRRLENLSEKTQEVARRASSVPVLGSEIQTRLEEVSARLSETAERVRRASRTPDEVIEVLPDRQS